MKYLPLGAYVERDVGVCSGRPTFKYTHIEIAGTLERLAAGEAIDQIVQGYRVRYYSKISSQIITIPG